MTKQSWQSALNALVIVVAGHSIGIGLLLLFFPLWSLRFVGWGVAGQVFWPSQAGLFLALLGAIYASAIRLRALIWFLIVSKTCAAIFLISSIALLDAPATVVTVMAVVDGLMGLSAALIYKKETHAGETRHESSRSKTLGEGDGVSDDSGSARHTASGSNPR